MIANHFSRQQRRKTLVIDSPHLKFERIYSANQFFSYQIKIRFFWNIYGWFIFLIFPHLLFPSTERLKQWSSVVSYSDYFVCKVRYVFDANIACRVLTVDISNSDSAFPASSFSRDQSGLHSREKSMLICFPKINCWTRLISGGWPSAKNLLSLDSDDGHLHIGMEYRQGFRLILAERDTDIRVTEPISET